MALGMSYDEFWNDDPTRIHAYIKSAQLKRERENYMAWLTGRYIYDALVASSPMFNSMSKRNKPFEYLDKPYELKSEETEREETIEREKVSKSANMFEGVMSMFNKARTPNE